MQVNLKVFGHSSFRPAQKAIVQQAVQGRDLFVLMATGGGKSLCYQVTLPGWGVVWGCDAACWDCLCHSYWGRFTHDMLPSSFKLLQPITLLI